MRSRRPRPLGAAAAAAILLGTAATGAAPQPAAPAVDYVGTHVWREAGEDFGGFSGIEISDDGGRYWALSDRGTIRWGSVERDEAGRIRHLTQAGLARLKDSEGAPLRPGRLGDAEGLALLPGGGFAVSFEGLDRVARYPDPDAPAQRLPDRGAFDALQPNAGLEALAALPSGALIAIAERSGDAALGFPVWRWTAAGGWQQVARLPRDDRWLPVGADIGPDGRLYVLERDFRGLRGFASRVRRFAVAQDGAAFGPPEVLLTTTPLQFDNLEGIAVWRDAQGLRLTMISDDNFLLVQRTELVEFRVRD